MNILINGKKYPVEVKLTQKAKSRGMMGRKHLEGGMLFIFNNPKEQYFWMKMRQYLLSISSDYYKSQNIVRNYFFYLKTNTIHLNFIKKNRKLFLSYMVRLILRS
jgi:hypothetical protein